MSVDYPIDKAWFRQKLSEKGSSQVRLAKVLDIDPAGISLMLNGKRAMKAHEAAAIARFLGVTVEEVVAKAGSDVVLLGGRGGVGAGGPGAVPVAGHVGEDGRVTMVEGEPASRAVAAADLPGDAIALRVRSAGTSFYLYDGWTFYAAPRQGEIAPDIVGRLCLVRLRDGTWMVRFAQRGYSPGFFTLVSFSGEILEDAAVDTAAAILWCRP